MLGVNTYFIAELLKVVVAEGKYGEETHTLSVIENYEVEACPVQSSKVRHAYGDTIKRPMRVIIRHSVPEEDGVLVHLNNKYYEIKEHNNYGDITVMLLSEVEKPDGKK